MNLDNIDIQSFLDNLILYDYMLFGGVFVLFILFLILAILLRKRFALALVFVLLSLVTLILGSTIGYIQLHKYLFKNTTKVVSHKKLTFTNAVIINATLTNNSKYNFENCKITVSMFKLTKNRYKNYLFKFKPFKKKSILQYDIQKNEKRNIKIIVEPFTYKKDYNISIKADCKGKLK